MAQTNKNQKATAEADLGITQYPVLQYWWSPPVTNAAATQAKIDEQQALAVHVTGNLISLNR